MITVFTYWFALLWNVPLNKEGFAGLSIIEFGIEIVLLLIVVFPMIILAIKEKRND